MKSRGFFCVKKHWIPSPKSYTSHTFIIFYTKMTCSHPKMKIEGTASVGTKWQIVIPKNVRNKFDLKTGSDLVVLSSDHAMVLIKSENLKEMISYFEEIVEQGKKL